MAVNQLHNEFIRLENSIDRIFDEFQAKFLTDAKMLFEKAFEKPINFPIANPKSYEELDDSSLVSDHVKPKDFSPTEISAVEEINYLLLEPPLIQGVMLNLPTVAREVDSKVFDEHEQLKTNSIEAKVFDELSVRTDVKFDDSINGLLKLSQNEDNYIEEKAARAYDLATLKYWGLSVHVNFLLEDYRKELEEIKNMTRQEYVADWRRKNSGFSRETSMHRGVTRNHKHGRRQARIRRVAGNHLEIFSTQEEATEAYDIATIKFRGTNDVERIMASNTFLVDDVDSDPEHLPSLPPRRPPVHQQSGPALVDTSPVDVSIFVEPSVQVEFPLLFGVMKLVWIWGTYSYDGVRCWVHSSIHYILCPALLSDSVYLYFRDTLGSLAYTLSVSRFRSLT